MSMFTIHTMKTAPAASRPILEKVKAGFGFIPNLLGGMSESPALADAYMTMSQIMAKTAFTTQERHVVWFTINEFHNCHYCMAAHTAGAKRDKVADHVIETARAGASYDDGRLEALRVFTLEMLQERGWVNDTAIETFLKAGFSKAHVLDVIVAISHKTLSNYTNHILQTPVDDVFESFSWQKAS